MTVCADHAQTAHLFLYTAFLDAQRPKLKLFLSPSSKGASISRRNDFHNRGIHMNSKDLARLAMIGITSGLLISAQSSSQSRTTTGGVSSSSNSDSNNSQPQGMSPNGKQPSPNTPMPSGGTSTTHSGSCSHDTSCSGTSTGCSQNSQPSQNNQGQKNNSMQGKRSSY